MLSHSFMVVFETLESWADALSSRSKTGRLALLLIFSKIPFLASRNFWTILIIVPMKGYELGYSDTQFEQAKFSSFFKAASEFLNLKFSTLLHIPTSNFIFDDCGGLCLAYSELVSHMTSLRHLYNYYCRVIYTNYKYSFCNF